VDLLVPPQARLRSVRFATLAVYFVPTNRLVTHRSNGEDHPADRMATLAERAETLCKSREFAAVARIKFKPDALRISTMRLA